MINFKDLKELSDIDIDFIAHYVFTMGDFVPIEDDHDYMAIKKYIRKILEIIEKDEEKNE